MLIESGVEEDQIITLALDEIDNARYRNPFELNSYVKDRIKDKKRGYYVFLDEIQFVSAVPNPYVDAPDAKLTFIDVVLGLMKIPNVDVYVTGSNSKMLSSDVSAGFDPMYEDVYEKKNAAFLACGPVFNKYTGSGGKSGSNDANPEYVAQLRKIMEDAKVHFQTAELGRVDVGGGGTIAYLMSVYGMEVIDSGVAVLGMHAPWETTSKADVYEAVRCYEAFLKAEF